MAESSYPFDDGTQVLEAQWARMAHLWASSGVDAAPLPGGGIDSAPLAVTAGSGMNVSIAPGGAWVEGFYYYTDGAVTRALDAADPTRARNDLIVLRLDRTAKTISPVKITGTPAASPVDPLMTRTSSIWDLPLERVVVPANIGTLAGSATFTDLRVSAWPYVPPPRAGTSFPAAGQVGQRFFRTDQHWEYIYSGSDWCIAPGQMLSFNTFNDPTGESYRAQTRIGIASGGAPALLDTAVPKCLPGHGLRFEVFTRFLTAGVTQGELVMATIAHYGGYATASGTLAPLTYLPPFRRIADGRYGVQYNTSFEGSMTVLGTDTFVTPTGRTAYALEGICATGVVQFFDGHWSLNSV